MNEIPSVFIDRIVFDENDQFDSGFLRSETFISKPFMLLSTDVTYDFLNVLLGVDTD
jgi:hypothetical protein